VTRAAHALPATLSLPSTFRISSSTEWRILCVAHPNVLLEGREPATDSALLLLEPHLFGPVISKRQDAPLAVPTAEVGALILPDVGGLTGEEQRALLGWIDATKGRTQIVSMTTQPLFPLVERGLFDPALYYRLNVMLLHVDDSAIILALHTRDAEADTSRPVSALQPYPPGDVAPCPTGTTSGHSW